ncbi:MAG: transcriptional regulator [Clostridiaceae bacterium]
MHNIDVENTLKIIGTALSKMFVPSAEVLIHELETGEIIFIENGHITGRKVGDKSDKRTLNEFFKNMDENGVLVNYSSATKSSKKLRSSTILIKDNENRPIYAFCINQDISILKDLKELINAYTETAPLISVIDAGNESIQKIANNIILEEIERAKPLSLDSKEAKMEIIRKLDVKGVFDVKDAVPKVCELLSISQATLYNYQREIRVTSSDI